MIDVKLCVQMCVLTSNLPVRVLLDWQSVFYGLCSVFYFSASLFKCNANPIGAVRNIFILDVTFREKSILV